MTRRLKTDIPGPDRRVTPEDVKEKGWEALFAPDLVPPFPLVVEIGFGRGEFLIDLATEAPGTAFVGVELSHKRVTKMARRLARMELGNVRLVEARGEDVVEELLAPGSVAAFWINFSDPWPKKRHHRRRLVQRSLVHAIAQRLAPDGVLQVATDDPGYAEWIDEILREEPLLENANAPEPYRREGPGRVRTAYELEWRAKGRVPCFWTYRPRLASVLPPPSPSGPGT